MDEGSDFLSLAAWRRQNAEMYAGTRSAGTPYGSTRSASTPYALARDSSSLEAAWGEFRRARSAMFRSHPQSPLGLPARERFRELAYFPYDPQWRFTARVKRAGAGRHLVDIDLPEGRLSLRPFGAVQVRSSSLTLFWIETYGGGVFLPFSDATSGKETYGGGRYLYDTIKGADLGVGPDSILLDFNYAYNPSCAYDPQWVCPLAPADNALPFRVEAGELAFSPG